MAQNVDSTSQKVRLEDISIQGEIQKKGLVIQNRQKFEIQKELKKRIHFRDYLFGQTAFKSENDLTKNSDE